MKRAGIYMRVSTDRQKKQDTIASQRRILPGLARDRGYKVVDQYVDEGASGESVEGRPEFQRLLGDVKLGKVDAIIAVDFDRITRSSNEMEQAFIRQTFKEHGVIIETINGTHDLKNYENALVSGIMGLVASMEKSKILARTRRGKETKWKNGKHASGHVPFGYRTNSTKEYVIEPNEAEIVQKVFELAAKGQGACVVANQLNALGVAVPSELRGVCSHARRYEGWSKSSVRKILDRTCYIGFTYVNVTQRSKGKRVAAPRSDWIKVNYPPLVSEGIYNEVQRLKKVQRTNSGRYNSKYIVSRLVRCECGSKLAVEPQRDGSFFYSCYRQRRLRLCDMPWQKGEQLETAIWNHVENLISNPDYLEEAIKESYKDWEETHLGTISRTVLEKKLEDKVIERNRVIRLHVRGKISEKEMDQQLDDIRKEEEIILENIALVDRAEEAKANIESSLEKIKRELKRVRKRIQNLGAEEKRRILQTLLGGDLITVSKNGEIEIPRVSDFKFIENTAEKIHLISNN